MTTLEEIAAELRAVKTEIADMRKASVGRAQWPKSPAQFGEYVGSSARTVQAWIDDGKLRANTSVRPALISRGHADRFFEGS